MFKRWGWGWARVQQETFLVLNSPWWSYWCHDFEYPGGAPSQPAISQPGSLLLKIRSPIPPCLARLHWMLDKCHSSWPCPDCTWVLARLNAHAIFMNGSCVHRLLKPKALGGICVSWLSTHLIPYKTCWCGSPVWPLQTTCTQDHLNQGRAISCWLQ